MSEPQRPSLPVLLLHRCFLQALSTIFYFHGFSSIALPVPLLHRCCRQLCHMFLFSYLFSTDAFRKLVPRFVLHSAPSTFPNLFPNRSVRLFPHLLSTDAFRYSYFHNISSRALAVSLLHPCFSHAISTILPPSRFPFLSSSDAYRKLFPRFFLLSASRTSSPPMLSASYFTCFSSRTSSPTTRFASYFHDFSSRHVSRRFPHPFCGPKTSSSISRSSR